MSVRARQKDRTRKALSDAALSLFLERGFDATTIDDVAARAGVSRRTFFRHFPTKEAAFFADQEARRSAFVARVEARPADVSVWKAVREALLATAAEYEVHREASLAWRRVMRSSAELVASDLQHDVAWERAIAAAFEQVGVSRFEAAVRAGAVMGVVRAVLVAWYEADGRCDLDAMGREAFGWLELGLRRGRTSP